jgi:hypothetical protein
MTRDALLNVDHREILKNYMTNSIKRCDSVKKNTAKAETVLSRICVLTAAGSQVLTHVPVLKDVIEQLPIMANNGIALGDVRNAALYGAAGAVAARAVITGIANYSKGKIRRSIVDKGFEGTELEKKVRQMGTTKVMDEVYPELKVEKEIKGRRQPVEME